MERHKERIPRSQNDMQIDNAISYCATISAPHINMERHTAAWVAKLLHQADAYEAWQDSAAQGAAVETSERLRRQYDMASAQVRAAKDMLRAAPASCPNRATVLLQARAKQLQVAHLTRLRTDEVTAGAELKIAIAFAYKASLGAWPDPIEMEQTSEARDFQALLTYAIGRARENAWQEADADTRDAVEHPPAPSYPRPAASILKAPTSRAKPKKSVHWAACAPPTPKVEAWQPPSRARARR